MKVIKVQEYTEDKITVTYDDASVVVFTPESAPTPVREIVVPIGVDIILKAE